MRLDDLSERSQIPLPTLKQLLSEAVLSGERELRLGLGIVERLGAAFELDPALLFLNSVPRKRLLKSKFGRLRWEGRLIMAGELLHRRAGEAFLALAETGSLREAGARLTPPLGKNGVRAAVRSLEQALQAPLFEHDGRGSRLTPLGDEVRQRILSLQLNDPE